MVLLVDRDDLFPRILMLGKATGTLTMVIILPQTALVKIIFVRGDVARVQLVEQAVGTSNQRRYHGGL